MKEIPDIYETTLPDVLRENGWNAVECRTSAFTYGGSNRAMMYITLEEIKKIELVTSVERKAAIDAFKGDYYQPNKSSSWMDSGVDAALEAAARVRLGLKP